MNLEEFKQDSDWQCCFNEAFGYGYCYRDGDVNKNPIHSVSRVIASDPGENDGPQWIALVEFAPGAQKMPFAKVYAGCDYTGWDCQAGGNVEFYATEEELWLPTTLTEDEARRLKPV